MIYVIRLHMGLYGHNKDLLEGINLRWEDEDWFQSLDYEHIPFKCRRCHEHGNLFRDCLKKNPTILQKGKELKDIDVFTKVSGRKSISKNNQGPNVNKKPTLEEIST